MVGWIVGGDLVIMESLVIMDIVMKSIMFRFHIVSNYTSGL